MPLQHSCCLATPEVEEAHKYHRQTMHSCLQAIIKQLLAVQLTILKEVKPKQTETAKSIKLYVGSANFGDLENWLMSICVNYAIAQLGGEDQSERKYSCL